MVEEILNLNNKIITNTNNSLLEITNNLQTLMNDSKENTIIKGLCDIIIKINNIINENKKNLELIKNEISKLYEQMNKQNNEPKNNNNNINNQEIKYNNSNRIKYIGQVLNGIPEGKGIMYWKSGDRYSGEWK